MEAFLLDLNQGVQNKGVGVKSRIRDCSHRKKRGSAFWFLII